MDTATREDLLNATRPRGHHGWMLRFLRFGVLLTFVFATSTNRAEAQLGCTDGPSELCIAQVFCRSETDCAAGQICESGFCRATGATPCAPCCLERDGIAGSLAGRVCSYTYPCDAVVQLTPSGAALGYDAQSLSSCFNMGSWASGDCDGDGTANGDVSGFDRIHCAQLVTVNTGILSRYQGSLVACTASGATLLGNRTCAPPPSIGLACSASSPCVHAAGDPPSRCAIPSGGTTGVCVFPGAPAGRLTPSESLDCLTSACVSLPPSGHASFNAGDCDGDGLVNREDPDICVPVRSVNALLNSAPVIVSAGGARPLSPVHATNGLGFAFDCAGGREHCPIVGDGVELVRCVGLAFPGAMMPSTSVCTYGFGPEPDNSCLLPSVMVSARDCAFEGSQAYDAWADGNCDGDDDHNAEDIEVCAPPVVHMEAGVLEAGVVEAGVRDAGDADIDAASTIAPDAGQMTFAGGGGCACHAHARTRGHASIFASLVMISLLARRRLRGAKA